MDLKILTAELVLEISNYRLLNIYNIANSTRQFVLKFAIPDSKKSLVLDCGNKVHLSNFERPIAPAPSNFVTKLRKHLKTRRLSAIKQVDNDRVLVLQFSGGDFYLVLEFFSAGNVLLLDRDLKIMALQRVVSDAGDHGRYAVNETYSMFTTVQLEKQLEYKNYSADDVALWILTHKEKAVSGGKKKIFSLHKLIFVNVSYLSSDLILKELLATGLDPLMSCLEVPDKQVVADAIGRVQQTFMGILESASDGKVEGVIVEKKNANFDSNDEDSLEFVFDEFHPFKPHKEHADKYRFETVAGYNNTLDKFFSTIESTKYALRVEQQKQHAKKRLDTARLEREKQIQALQNQQDLNEKKGTLIMLKASFVEQCMELVQSLINRQMDWNHIESYIRLEQNKSNKVAQAIKTPLNLRENKITLQLTEDANETNEDDSDLSESESESESDSESEYDSDDLAFEVKKTVKKPSVPRINIEVDLSLTAYANASLYFDLKKNAVSKQKRVEKSSEMAIKNAELKIQRDLAKTLKNEQDSLRTIRPKYWFEKFFWFITSDGFLCLAGKDDAQVDMIYFRHFNDSGYFVSSDVEDALKVFVLNPYKGRDVSPSALWQAGTFALLASNAWNSKTSASAWWMKGLNVSKRFDGTLLDSGRLAYEGEKFYMPPGQLVMGFALLWMLDEESAKKHTEARVSKQEEHGLRVETDNKKASLEGLLIPEPKAEPEAEPEAELELYPEPEDTPEPHEKPKANVRGKKGKLKKLSKYADQDEEERRMRMEALGTLKQIEEKSKPVDSAPKARIERKGRPQRSAEKEFAKYLKNEEDEESGKDYLLHLDALVAKPSKGDVVGGLVPVFAPWSALAKYKYKVKVQPGLGKKGKLLTEALKHLEGRKVDSTGEDADMDTEEEHRFIKEATSADVIGVFTVNKMKLSIGDDKRGAKKSGGKRK